MEDEMKTLEDALERLEQQMEVVRVEFIKLHQSNRRIKMMLDAEQEELLNWRRYND
jgi:hypothetical protein